MAWLILTIVLGIVTIGGLLYSRGAPPGHKFGAQGIAGGAILAWLILTFFMSLHTVGQREIGVVYNFSGTITGTKSAGLVGTLPWQHIQRENVGIQREDFDLSADNAAVSSDQQPVYAQLSLNYQVEPTHVLDLYKRVGPQWKQVLLDSRVLQDFKEVTSQFTAQQITTQRQQLRVRTRERLTQELNRYDVHVVDFFVKNLDYTQAYRDAINAKNVQVQQALQAEAKVKQAEAEARQEVAKAKGDAQAIALKGKALHNNPEVLQLEAIDKLNPNAQMIICTGKTCPSFLPQSGGSASKP